MGYISAIPRSVILLQWSFSGLHIILVLYIESSEYTIFLWLCRLLIPTHMYIQICIHVVAFWMQRSFVVNCRWHGYTNDELTQMNYIIIHTSRARITSAESEYSLRKTVHKENEQAAMLSNSGSGWFIPLPLLSTDYERQSDLWVYERDCAPNVYTHATHWQLNKKWRLYSFSVFRWMCVLSSHMCIHRLESISSKLFNSRSRIVLYHKFSLRACFVVFIK